MIHIEANDVYLKYSREEDNKYYMDAAKKNHLIAAFIEHSEDNITTQRYLSVILRLVIAVKNFQTSMQAERLFPEYSKHEINHSYKIMDYMYGMLGNKKKVNGSTYFYLIMAALCHDLGMTIITTEDIRRIKNNEYLASGLQARKYNWEKVLKSVKDDDKSALSIIARSLHPESEVVENKVRFLLGKEYNDYLKNAEWQFIFKTCYSHGISVEEIKEEIGRIDGEYGQITRGNDGVNFALVCSLLRIGDLLDISVKRIGEYNQARDNPFNIINEFVESVEIRNDVVDDNYLKCVSGNDSNSLCTRIEKYIYIIFNDDALQKIDTDADYENAYISLLGYFDQIESELTNLKVLLNCSSDNGNHIDMIKPHINEHLRYNGNRYSYLKISVDEDRILSEIMSESLYGNSDIAIRELLQNAFDACHARMINNQTDYTPIIKITYDDSGDRVFSISDNGIGMNQAVIENYFLKAGKSLYKSDRYRYSDKQFFHAGYFGMGVFSTFMLTSQMNVKTVYNERTAPEYNFIMKKDGKYAKINAVQRPDLHAGTEVQFVVQNVENSLHLKDVDALKKFIKRTFLKADHPEIVLSINGEVCELPTIEEVLAEQKHILYLNSDMDIEVNLSDYLEGVAGYVYLERCPCNILFYNSHTKEKDFYSDCEYENGVKVAVIDVLEKETNKSRVVKFVIPWDEYIKDGNMDIDGIETVSHLDHYLIMNHNFYDLCGKKSINISNNISVKRYKATYNGISSYHSFETFDSSCNSKRNKFIYLNNILIDKVDDISLTLPMNLPYHACCLVMNIINFDEVKSNEVKLLISRNNFDSETGQLIQTAIKYAVYKHLSKFLPDEEKIDFDMYLDQLHVKNNFLIKKDVK